MKKFKQIIYNIINDRNQENFFNKAFHVFISTIILINCIFVILETYPLPKNISFYINIFGFFSIIIFTIEYVLRVYTATLLYKELPTYSARLKYIHSFLGVIDLLVIFPFYFPTIIPIDLKILKSFRILRLVRLLKLTNYADAFTTIRTVFKRKSSELISSALIVGTLLIISSILMYNAENPAQPDVFKSAFTGLWWSIIAVTAVGLGDIYPITTLGRFIGSLICILGVGFIAIPTGIISAGFIEVSRESSTNTYKKDFCPYCGKNIKN